MSRSKSKQDSGKTAEDRWQLSRRMTPEASSVPNEHLIQDMIVTLGRTRSEIVEQLLLYPRNLDCIIDDAQRAGVAVWLGVKEPTEGERVLYIKDQIARSSGTGDAWAALLNGSKLRDRAAYHNLRLQRLDEQVGRAFTQERYRRNKASAGGSKGGSFRLSDIKDITIPRDPTGLEGFDRLGGQDDDDFSRIGWCRGDVVLVGGAPGVGKTKVMMTAAAIAAGPVVGDTVLYIQSEFDIETFKKRYGKCVKGDEDLYISCATAMGDVIEEIYRRRPRWVIIDSKDKIEECKTSAGWSRFQHRMRQIAKELGLTVFLITHLNNDDKIYGGRKVEHDVDAVVLATRTKGTINTFQLRMPSKNRGGVACEEHFGTWVHVGTKIVCVQLPPLWKTKDTTPPPANPLLNEPPTSTMEEELLEHEMNDLLEKVHNVGMEGLSDREKERLAHITEFLTKRDDKRVIAKRKEALKKKSDKEKAEREKAERDAQAAGNTGAGEDEDEAGEEWKKGVE